jgi:hypothetical protein
MLLNENKRWIYEPEPQLVGCTIQSYTDPEMLPVLSTNLNCILDNYKKWAECPENVILIVFSFFQISTSEYFKSSYQT